MNFQDLCNDQAVDCYTVADVLNNWKEDESNQTADSISTFFTNVLNDVTKIRARGSGTNPTYSREEGGLSPLNKACNALKTFSDAKVYDKAYNAYQKVTALVNKHYAEEDILLDTDYWESRLS